MWLKKENTIYLKNYFSFEEGVMGGELYEKPSYTNNNNNNIDLSYHSSFWCLLNYALAI